MEQDIYIGTLVQVNAKARNYMAQMIPHGFESFALTFNINDFIECSPERVADAVMPLLEEHGVKVGAISIYGNPLADTEGGKKELEGIRRLVECAGLFKTGVVSGFTGRVPGASVPDSIPRFKEVWQPIAERAGELGVKIAFENCPMGDSWQSGRYNLAFCQSGWELMFDAITLPNIGLEWEPCHQMVQLVDPIPQIREWGSRFFHLHGKDATVRHDVLSKYGILSPVPFAYHRTPGFGDSNWNLIISELRMTGFKGSIDIEGWHDPVYRGELEITGQVAGLNYLKSCRPPYIPNPA